MLAAGVILVFALFTIFFVPAYSDREEEEVDTNKTPQIKKLWNMAQTAMQERKPLKAEKALLTILKFDEKNAAAYNRLGILYAREKHFKEAIECFEIAQSLDNNASSLHNVGLIYYETGKYEQAAIAFQQAIDIEGDQPARYIALAKALEKLGKRKQAVDALETAYSFDPNSTVLRHMLEFYENIGDAVNIARVQKRLEELAAASTSAKKPRAHIIRTKSTKEAHVQKPAKEPKMKPVPAAGKTTRRISRLSKSKKIS